MAEDDRQITIKKPSTQLRRHLMTLEGTAPPGTAVEVKPNWEDNQVSPETDLTTRAGSDGRWVQGNVRTPTKDGVYRIDVKEVSVESTPATTTTTFEVKDHRK